MNTFKKQLVGVVSTGLVLAQVLAPGLALAGQNQGGETDIEISGNGAYSSNDAHLTSNNNTTVVQSNLAQVTNVISANSSTGGNDSSLNTNGDVLIHTGDAVTGVSVNNVLNSNSAKVDCCDQGDTKIKVTGNGAYSENEAKLRQNNNNSIFQDNYADVVNVIDANSKTGGNGATLNTGGDVTIDTGDATTIVDVATKANSNVAQIGGHGGNGGSLEAIISGNGAFSDNDVILHLNKDNLISQDNYAYVLNDIYTGAKTGYNDADLNTGGDTLIVTGDAESITTVDNLVNFNWADVDCGCLNDITAKVAANGAFSENELKARLGGDTNVFQGEEGNGNNAYLTNLLDGVAKTGKNDSELNTGPVLFDPNWIVTGDATTLNGVQNAGNVNVYGSGLPSDWPDMGFDFDFGWDWSSWWLAH